MKDIDLQSWLLRMSQGDEEAFQVIYSRTREHAYKLIYYLAPNKQDVNDIMSEVYMQLFKSIKNYDNQQKFSSWFNGLIIRQVRSWKRKSWRRYRVLEKLLLFNSSKNELVTEDDIKDVNDQLELLPILEALSQKLKEVIILKYYQEYSYEEISKLLCIPVGTVKSRHHLAIKEIRRHINRYEELRGKDQYVY